MSTDKLWPDKAITVKTREKRQDRITDKRLWTKEAFVSEEGNIQGFVSEEGKHSGIKSSWEDLSKVAATQFMQHVHQPQFTACIGVIAAI